MKVASESEGGRLYLLPTLFSSKMQHPAVHASPEQVIRAAISWTPRSFLSCLATRLDSAFTTITKRYEKTKIWKKEYKQMNETTGPTSHYLERIRLFFFFLFYH